MAAMIVYAVRQGDGSVQVMDQYVEWDREHGWVDASGGDMINTELYPTEAAFAAKAGQSFRPPTEAERKGYGFDVDGDTLIGLCMPTIAAEDAEKHYGDKVGATDVCSYYSDDGQTYAVVDRSTGKVRQYRRATGYSASDTSPHDDLLLLTGRGEEPLLCQCDASGHIVSDIPAFDADVSLLTPAQAKWLDNALSEPHWGTITPRANND